MILTLNNHVNQEHKEIMRRRQSVIFENNNTKFIPQEWPEVMIICGFCQKAFKEDNEYY